jgi:sugar/nucleoside kinase (ribokinase family)
LNRKKMPTVLVIGDVMTDIIVRPDGPIAVGADRRATIRMLPGGAGANQACWLAHEGVSTRFVARVGASDRARQKMLLAGYGVDARLGADEIQPTGTLVNLLSPDGERSFLTDRGANLKLGRADLPASLLGGVDFLHVSGYMLFEKEPRAAVLEIIAEAKRRKIPFAVDPASSSFLQEVGRDRFLEWTKGAQFFFLNTDEAEVLTGAHEPDAQLAILAQTFPVVALKRGREGAMVAEGERRWSVPAPNVSALDTSGAGDAFLGGFLGAYLKKEGTDAALRRGVALGSQSVTTFGARPPLPSA